MSAISLKTKNVEYGWGYETKAIEFPIEVAVMGLALVKESGEQYYNQFFVNTCLDVIKNYSEGDETYIMEDFYGGLVKEYISLWSKYVRH